MNVQIFIFIALALFFFVFKITKDEEDYINLFERCLDSFIFCFLVFVVLTPFVLIYIAFK